MCYLSDHPSLPLDLNLSGTFFPFWLAKHLAFVLYSIEITEKRSFYSYHLFCFSFNTCLLTHSIPDSMLGRVVPLQHCSLVK
jgi:hypothetical protein